MSRSTILVALLAVGVAVFLVERWIVTDREAIEAWADAAEDAVEESDERRLTELLAPDFEMGRLDRERSVRRALRAKRDYGVLSVDVTLEGIEIEGDRAEADAVIEGKSMGRLWRFETHLVFARYPEGWALVSADPIVP